jgi:hypothetical protein
LYINNSVGGEEVKAAHVFELNTLSIQIPHGFWIVGAVKVQFINVYYLRHRDNPKPKWNLNGKSV